MLSSPTDTRFQYCAVSRARLPQADLLRFVVSPQGELTLDLTHRLPGEVFWVVARQDAVAGLPTASGYAAPDNLLTQVDNRLVQQLLARLSLARKAGQIVLGFAKVEAALVGGRVRLLLAARDGGVHGRKTLGRHAAARNVPLRGSFTAAQLSVALGRANVIHAGVTSNKWAQQIMKEVDRLQTYQGETTGAGEPSG